MAVSAVAAAIDHAFLGGFRDLERPGFILVQRPEVVLFVEVGFTPRRLIRLKFRVAGGQQFPVSLRRDTSILFLAGGTVSGESKHIHAMFHHSVYNVGNLFDVHP